jgi:putative membrane protein
LIGILHVGFLVYETFLWDSARDALAPYFAGGAPAEGEAGREMIRALFWNQGIYNGFLAAGLFWSVLPWNKHPTGKPKLAIFFLTCVAIAGFFGFLTANFNPVFLIQALPATTILAILIYQGGSADSTVPAA